MISHQERAEMLTRRIASHATPLTLDQAQTIRALLEVEFREVEAEADCDCDCDDW